MTIKRKRIVAPGQLRLWPHYNRPSRLKRHSRRVAAGAVVKGHSIISRNWMTPDEMELRRDREEACA